MIFSATRRVTGFVCPAMNTPDPNPLPNQLQILYRPTIVPAPPVTAKAAAIGLENPSSDSQKIPPHPASAIARSNDRTSPINPSSLPHRSRKNPTRAPTGNSAASATISFTRSAEARSTITLPNPFSCL